MYIPEFVCGIVATILAEIAGIVVWYAVDTYKKKKKQNQAG